MVKVPADMREDFFSIALFLRARLKKISTDERAFFSRRDSKQSAIQNKSRLFGEIFFESRCKKELAQNTFEVHLHIKPRPTGHCKIKMDDVDVALAVNDEEFDLMALMTVAAAAVVYSQQQCNKRRRLHWVHPVNAKRDELGEYATVFRELRCDSQLFNRYFRMSTIQFDELLAIVGPHVQLQNTRWRNSIEPAQQLAICLR
jgi:hypothetical protein